MFGQGKGRPRLHMGTHYVTWTSFRVDSQGREEEAMNALNERQKKLRIELEKRRQASRTEASSEATSSSADPITETPANSETVPENKKPRKKNSKKSKKKKN